MINEPILFYRVEDAARLLSISRSKAYELIAKGLIPSVRIGSSRGVLRVPREAVEKLVRDAMADHQDPSR